MHLLNILCSILQPFYREGKSTTTPFYSAETDRSRGHLMSHSKDLAGMGFESGSLAPKSILSSLHSTAWQLQRYYKKEAMAS